jgi:hypothetical protein
MPRKLKLFRRDGYVLIIDPVTGEKWKLPDGQVSGELDGESIRGPSKFRKAANFLGAAASHVAAGSPKSSDELIADRFSICRECPSDLFIVLRADETPKALSSLPLVGTCQHKKCGCYIHDESIQPNKLAWTDQKCPMGHW